MWCQGGPANGWRYHTLIEPDDEITVVPVIPGRRGTFFRAPRAEPGEEKWPNSTVYVREREAEQIDGECIYYPKDPA